MVWAVQVILLPFLRHKEAMAAMAAALLILVVAVAAVQAVLDRLVG
jgi:hypothetical protein